MRIRHTMPAIGLICLTIAGCTTVSPGEATPAPTSEASSTSSSNNDDLPTNGAPKVENPLKGTSRFEQDPCSILTAEQAENLDLPATGKKDEGAAGLDCEWRNPDTRGRVTIGLLVNIDSGLSAAYAAHERGEYSLFDSLPPVEGYPAVALGIDDHRSEGLCSVEVGLTDQLAFHVDVQLSQVNVGTKDPCETAAKVAGQALQTMKEGA